MMEHIGIGILFILGVILQRIAGTGFAMVVIPYSVILYGPVEGVMVVNILSLPALLFLALPLLKEMDRKRTFYISTFSILGLVPGAYLVQVLPAAWVQLFIGLVMLLALVVSSLYQPLRTEKNPDGVLAMSVCGFISGFLMATSAIPAPALVIYERVVNWDHRSFTASVQVIMLIQSIPTLGAKFLMGTPYPEEIFGIPFTFGVVLLGIFSVWIGQKLAKKVPLNLGKQLALLVSFLAAGISLIQACRMLWG